MFKRIFLYNANFEFLISIIDRLLVVKKIAVVFISKDNGLF